MGKGKKQKSWDNVDMIMKTIVGVLVGVLLMSWGMIDVILLILLRTGVKGNMAEEGNKLHRRSIERKKDKLDWISSILSGLFSVGVIYLIIYLIPNTTIQGLAEWYKEFFAVTLLPIVYDWIKEKKIIIKTGWRIVFSIYILILSVACCIMNVEKILQKRIILNFIITFFVFLLIETVVEICKESRKQHSVKISAKKLWKDLYQRTSEIDIDMSTNGLIKGCEKQFVEYRHRCNKISRLHTIEYVNLSGKYKKTWCDRIIRLMKRFVLGSIIIGMIDIFYSGISGLSTALGIIALVGISKFLINRSQQIAPGYIYVIIIQVFYHEWGYYLTYSNKSKFVGTVQMIELSKYHKYVHSFLDIVALCRAVAINDQLKGTNRMSIITSNLSELFENYSDDGDCKQDRNWVTLIPLWAATLFEFSVTGTVNADAKPVLLEYADASARFDISMFLQSFWADMERKELSDGVAEFVQAFERELYKVETYHPNISHNNRKINHQIVSSELLL